MKASVTPAKITRPTSSGLFPRNRLFRILDRSLAQPIIWVTGPPGSGKTSLVASYLDARQIPRLWYQVDEGDSDIASFFITWAWRQKKPLLEKENLSHFSLPSICKVSPHSPDAILKTSTAG